jgi:hypothetical protein
MLALTPKIIIAITRYQAMPGSAAPEALPPSIFPSSGGSASIHFPKLRRLCLHPFSQAPEALPPSIFPAEAEPLDIGSQAEPRNQLITY